MWREFVFATVYLLLVSSTSIEAAERVLKWYAPFLADSGFGAEATQFIEALALVRPSVATHIQAVQFAEPSAFRPESAALAAALRPYNPRGKTCNIVICHSTPPFWVPSEFPSWDRVAPCPPRDAAVKIGRAMYETDSLPSSWIPKINGMDEVWVPTKFALETFIKTGVMKEKVRVVPEPFNVERFNRQVCKRNTRSSNIFNFAAIFKWEERKGWKQLLRAFFDEFSSDENVHITIKTSAFHLGANKTPSLIAFEHFPELNKIKHRVHIIDERLSEDELIQRIYCQAQVICSPSYGEGWGRVPAEASAMEIPVIYTNYSGLTEFLNDSIAFPIRVEKLIPAFDEGHLWALPSLDSLRNTMRNVYQNYDIARIKANRARNVITSMYSLQAVGQYVWNILKDRCLEKMSDEL